MSEKSHSTHKHRKKHRDDEEQTDKQKDAKSQDRCSICHKSKKKLEEDNEKLIKLECHHKFCSQCLKNFTDEQMSDEKNLNIRCPICNYPLRDKEVDHIDPSFNQTLDERFIKHTVKDDQLITCPKCKEGFIYKAGKTAGITKDQNGELIRPQPLESLRKYRAECSKCGTVFCVNCGCVPFHEGLTCEEKELVKNGVVCRFCREFPAVSGVDQNVCHRVCWHDECKKWLPKACMHVCHCGHACCGVRSEKKHFGCAVCRSKRSPCTICLQSCTVCPSVVLRCGHPVHRSCLVEMYKKREKMSGKVDIPRCRHNMECDAIPYNECVKDEAEKWIEIDQKIDQLIKERMVEEDTENEECHVKNPDDKDYFNQPYKFAKDNFVFYFCKKCHQPFYGGHKECEIEEEENNDNDDDVDDENSGYTCLRCQRVFLDVDCKIHGHNSMVYKCFFCCNPAVTFCWGRVYFCSECHKNPRNAMREPFPVCDGKCQFAPHAENGKRIVQGYCLMCELEKEKKTIKI